MIAGEIENGRQQSRSSLLHGQPLKQAAVDLNLSGRADPDADPEGRPMNRIAFQAVRRIELIFVDLKAGFDEHSMHAHGLRIFRHERPLLTTRGHRDEQTKDQSHQDRLRASGSRLQACYAVTLEHLSPPPRYQRRRLSSISVTGPSLTSSTSMWA